MFGKDTPVQQVVDMRRQGVSDNQIVQQLQQKGLSTQQIFEAMSQADLSNISGQGYAVPDMQQEMPQPEPFMSQPSYGEQPVQHVSDDHVQEVAEAVVNEKMDEIVNEVQKVVAWKDTFELEMQKLKEDMDVLRADIVQLRQGVLGKVSEYDAHMRDVSSELKAVHKVFKDVIPSFTENVAELSEITKKIKKR